MPKYKNKVEWRSAHLDRTSWFKQVTIRPRIVVRGKSREVVQRALDMAMKYSTINQSFKCKVVVEPDIIINPPTRRSHESLSQTNNDKH
ncbi:MAG TPA: hypothetical protein VGY56_13505 [Verrucomicrobiae bacterium]|nr:hypothetical protein [Verrucomicrobiae bacterium]